MGRTLFLVIGVVFLNLGFDGRSIEAANPDQRVEQSQIEGVKIEKEKAVVQRGYKVSKDGDKAVVTKEGDTKPVTILICACLTSGRQCGMIVEPSAVRCETGLASHQCDIDGSPLLCHIKTVIHEP